MKIRLLLVFTILCTSILAAFQIARSDDGWVVVAPGIEYKEWSLPDPNRVYAARMERDDPNLIIESSIARGRLNGGRETVSGMYRRYDGALNNWGAPTSPHPLTGWGSLSDVVVAINGSFFDANGAWGGQFQSGWYATRYKDSESRNTFTWGLDRVPEIRECVRNPADKQFLTYHYLQEDIETTQVFSDVNRERGDDQLILYTPQYSNTTGTDNNGIEVVVQMITPTLIPSTTFDLPFGYITAIRDGKGNTPIPFDSVVLSASGDDAQILRNHAVPGEKLAVTQTIRNCKGYPDYDWRETYASVIGSFYFLKDGKYQPDDDPGANVRNPRTAVAFNDRYIYFVVVDGRFPGISVGMTMAELADFAIQELGATYGINQDGGGSSTIVVNGEVKNFPSDGVPKTSRVAPYDPPPEQDKRVYLPMMTKNAEPIDLLPKVERSVANGLMMVVVQPAEFSSAGLQPGDAVTAHGVEDIMVRLGPGDNYSVLATVPPDTPGVIAEHLNNLNGVLAKDAYWWLVDFGDTTGWVTEDSLTLQP